MLTSILPGPLAYRFSRLERYGLLILIALIILLATLPALRRTLEEIRRREREG